MQQQKIIIKEKELRDYAKKIGYKSKFFFSSPNKEINFLFWMEELRRELRDNDIYVDIFTEMCQDTFEIYFNWFILINSINFGEKIDTVNYFSYEEALKYALKKGLEIYHQMRKDKIKYEKTKHNNNNTSRQSP